MVWPTLGSKTAKEQTEQNTRLQATQLGLVSLK